MTCFDIVVVFTKNTVPAKPEDGRIIRQIAVLSHFSEPQRLFLRRQRVTVPLLGHKQTTVYMQGFTGNICRAIRR